MGTNFTDIATTDPIVAATINDRLDQLDAAIESGLGGVTLTNKSGGSLAANDCVIIDTSNNEAVKTTTSTGDTNRPGIVLAGGAADAEVTISFLGEVTVVVSASATRGQFFKTSTTAKRVAPTSTLDVGVFGIFTTNSSGGAGTTARGLLLGTVITAPGTHTHAASDIISGILALARGGNGADLSATGPGYLKQASGGAVVTVGAIAAGDLPAATESVQGAVELATNAETATGTDTSRAIHPAAVAAAYFLRSLFINTSAGAGDAGKPIVLDAAGKIAASMIAPSTIDHNQLLNLAASDPHTQYILKSLLTTKGDILVRDSSGPQRLAAGAEGQVLAVSTASPTGLTYVPQVSGGSGIPGSTITAKGDLIVGTAAATYTALPVGAAGQVPVADPAQAGGIAWAYLLQDNIFINGGFDLWQRTIQDTGVTTTRKYVPDRWGVKTGAGTLAFVQRSTTLRTGARSKYALQLDGAVSVTTVDVDQRIEAAFSAIYKRQVNFSAYVYNGTGADFTPKLFVSTPSAADNWGSSTVRNGGGSGEDLQVCTDSAWTQVTWNADISSYTNIDNGVEFRLQIPSGALVASKTVRLAELNLVPGGVVTPFVALPVPISLMMCRRYYLKSYPQGTTPGTASADAAAIGWQTRTAIAANVAGTLRPQSISFPVVMRAAPTVLLYSPGDGASGVVRNDTVGFNRTGCTAANIGDSGFYSVSVSNVSGTVISLDDALRFHFTAEAEL